MKNKKIIKNRFESKKFFLVVFGILLVSLLFVNFASAGWGVIVPKVCGDGIVQDPNDNDISEKCDAGQLFYANKGNYNTLDIGCSAETCSCPEGIEPQEEHFKLNDTSCITITDCYDGCAEGDLECRCDDRGIGCPALPEVQNCVEGGAHWAPFGGLESGSCIYDCPADSHDASVESGGTTVGFCKCDSGFVSDGYDQCVPQPLCDGGGISCEYDLLGEIKTECCSADQICDSQLTGCIDPPTSPIPSTPPFPGPAVSIEVSSGSAESRDVVCSATVTPDQGGTYNFIFRLVPSSVSGTTSQIVEVIPPCNLLSPHIFKVSYTFTGLLNKDSPAYKCQLEYSSPSGTPYLSVSGALQDLDKDTSVSKNQFEGLQSWSPYDIDDWVFNDAYGDSTNDYICLASGSADYYEVIIPEIKEKRKNCTVDNNNDAIGDYAACSYCRNPRAGEVVDNIDNDGFGVCQANISRSCRVSDYVGDGASSSYVTTVPISASDSQIFGCGGVKNEFGVSDDFCQMMDNGGNYQRGVVSGEKEIKNEVFNIDLGDLGFFHYTEKHIVSFSPGGVNEKNSVCALQIVYTETINGGNPNSPLAPFEPLMESSQFSAQYFSGFTLNGNVLSKTLDYNNCIPSSENLGKTRNTDDLPSQFIDSMYGELDFQSFLQSPNIQNILSQKDSSGNFLWNWETSYVDKDKCNDGVDNNGAVSLYDVQPYGFYISQITQIYDPIKDKTTQIQNNFQVPLVDVDDPSCKFENPKKVSEDVFHVYSYDEFKKNPLTNKNYCLDSDGDGFCGLISLEDKSYSISKQFPDCDDTKSDDSYVGEGGQALKPLQAYGWPSGFGNVLFGAWNVHPFSPVTKTTCTLNNYDFNCNKNGFDGLDFNSLLSGGTPFDLDSSTGKEYIDQNNVLNNGNIDAVCYEYPPYRDATIITAKAATMLTLPFVPGVGFIMGLKVVQVPLAIYDAYTMGDCLVDGKVDSLCVSMKILSMVGGAASISHSISPIVNVRLNAMGETVGSNDLKLVINAVTKERRLVPVKPMKESLAAPRDSRVIEAPEVVTIPKSEVGVSDDVFLRDSNFRDTSFIESDSSSTAFFTLEENRYHFDDYELPLIRANNPSVSSVSELPTYVQEWRSSLLPNQKSLLDSMLEEFIDRDYSIIFSDKVVLPNLGKTMSFSEFGTEGFVNTKYKILFIGKGGTINPLEILAHEYYHLTSSLNPLLKVYAYDNFDEILPGNFFWDSSRQEFLPDYSFSNPSAIASTKVHLMGSSIGNVEEINANIFRKRVKLSFLENSPTLGGLEATFPDSGVFEREMFNIWRNSHHSWMVQGEFSQGVNYHMVTKKFGPFKWKAAESVRPTDEAGDFIGYFIGGRSMILN